VCGEINGVGNLSRACTLQLDDIALGPYDLGTVLAVELLYALAGVAGNLAEGVDSVG
jgi:hypothetical protein